MLNSVDGCTNYRYRLTAKNNAELGLSREFLKDMYETAVATLCGIGSVTLVGAPGKVAATLTFANFNPFAAFMVPASVLEPMWAEDKEGKDSAESILEVSPTLWML